MNTTELTTYSPYTAQKSRDNNYSDITFQNEGLMTIPKASANTIVKLLNDAFQNGVKMTIKTSSMQQKIDPFWGENEVKSKPMPQEEPVPINSFRKK